MTRYFTLFLAAGALLGAVAFAAVGSERVSFVESGFGQAPPVVATGS